MCYAQTFDEAGCLRMFKAPFQRGVVGEPNVFHVHWTQSFTASSATYFSCGTTLSMLQCYSAVMRVAKQSLIVGTVQFRLLFSEPLCPKVALLYMVHAPFMCLVEFVQPLPATQPLCT